MSEPFMRPFPGGDGREWYIDRGDGVVIESGSESWCRRRLPEIRAIFRGIRRQCQDAALRRAIEVMGDQ